MLEVMKSVRDEFQSFKKSSTEVEVDQISTSASKPGTNKQSENLDPNPPSRTQPAPHSDEAMEVDLYGPSLPPHLGGDHSMDDSDPRHVLDQHSDQSKEPSWVVSAKPKKHAGKRNNKIRSRYLPQSSSSEEVETFRRILDLPDPRETMPRSSTSVLGPDDKKGQQELRPRGPSSMLPLSSHIKDAFDKFEHDFQAANLPEGKYIKPPPSTAKWYKVGQPCYEYKIQELKTDLSKICISQKPSGAPMGKVPLSFLKELEHQAWQNLSTINFTAAFAKTSFSCNSTLEKCQHCLKSSFKKVKTQIQKGADPKQITCPYTPEGTVHHG